MKSQKPGFLGFILMVLLGILVVRFLPLLIRGGLFIVMGLRAFWWALLPLLVIGVSAWRIKRRRELAGDSEYPSENKAPRDVTGSLKDL